MDFLFPKYCVSCKKLGSYLCENCFARLSFSQNYVCLACDKPSFNGLTHMACAGRHTIDGVFSIISYNKIVKKLIHVFKYKPFVTDIKSVLVDLFYEGLIQNEVFYKILQSEGDFVLSPIPLHGQRFQQRGYNQSEVLANGLSEKLNISVRDLLIRTKRTRPQFGLKKKERIENIKNVFEISKKLNLREGSTLKQYCVFLVDDVLTTGSTLFEAANVLKINGAKKVYGLTLARD